MIKSVFFFCFLIFISCGVHHRNVNKVVAQHYSSSERDTSYLSCVELFRVEKNPYTASDVYLNKSLYYSPNSHLNRLFLQTYNSSGDGGYFELEWTNTADSSERKLFVEHAYFDSINNCYLTINLLMMNDSIQKNGSNITIEFTSDSLEYSRSLMVTPALAQQYVQFAQLNNDSVLVIENLSMVDYSTCTELMSSRYTETKSVSTEEKLFRIVWTDSAMVAGALEIDSEIHDYYHLIEHKPTNLTISKNYNPNRTYYIEEHTVSGMNFPIYRCDIRRNSSNNDTTYHMEMVSGTKLFRRFYAYTIYKERQTSVDWNDQRIPIVKREFQIWTNKRGKAKRFHAIAITSQGHRLEYACKRLDYRIKVTIDKRKIPELSGEQLYDLKTMFFEPGSGYYPFPEYKKRVRHVLKRRAQIQFPFDFETDTRRIEKNRKSHSEKRVSRDMSRRFEIFYE